MSRAEQQVELLVGAAELDVGRDRDRVVALEQRVQQLEQRDRRVGGKPLGEVVALEDLRDGGRARQAEQLLHRHVEPFAVESHFDPLRVEHLEGLLLEGRALASISSPESNGRTVAERPLGSPTRAV